MQTINKEDEKKPLWRRILIMIVKLWVILMLIDAVIEIFIALTTGLIIMKIPIEQLFIWLFAGILAYKLHIFRFARKKNNKQN